MPDIDTAALPVRRWRTSREDRPDIIMPDGQVWRPRFRVAAGAGVHERTLKRKNTRTIYVGNVAYVEVNSAISDLVGKPQRRNEPPHKRKV
jgi:hypothetical protein